MHLKATTVEKYGLTSKISRGVGAFDHLKWTYSGAFERLFGPGEGNLTDTNSKSSNGPGVSRGGMLNLQFDRYISIYHRNYFSTRMIYS